MKVQKKAMKQVQELISISIDLSWNWIIYNFLKELYVQINYL